jgi:zinc protease
MLSFAVGTQDDPPGMEGLAALTANMIAEGATTENSWDEILAKLYPMASSYSVRVDKEMTTLSGRAHRDNIEAFFGLFTDAFLRPAFSEFDLERLRDQQRNFLEKTLRYASDEELGKAALTSFIFEGSPYAHPTEGTVAGLGRISLEDIRQFYSTYYTLDNAVLALGGGYPEDLVERFSSSVELLTEGSPETIPASTPPAIEGLQVLLVDKPGADASISFGFPIAIHRGERDYYALWIANSWLGEHRNSSSHLYQVIREVRGINYGDYSYIEAFPQGGRRQMPPTNVARRQQIFEVWIRTLPNERAHFALRAALREITNLIEHGLSEEEFDLTRSFLNKYSLHFAETTTARLGYAVDDRFYGIDGGGHLKHFREMLRSMTRQEVNDALKRHLQVDDLKIAIVTGTAAALQEALVQDKPSPIHYDSEKSKKVLAEDEEISTFPLEIAPQAVRVVPVDQIFEN